LSSAPLTNVPEPSTLALFVIGLVWFGSMRRLSKAKVTGYTAVSEVDPGFGTMGLVGKRAVPLLNGADHDEENQTED
jgi:hypothetical protein